MAQVTIRPVGKPAAMAKLHKALSEGIASGDIDHIEVSADGQVVGNMILDSMVDPGGVVKAHPTDPSQDAHKPHPPGAAHSNIYEYHLVSKP